MGAERFELSLERILSHAASACWATHPRITLRNTAVRKRVIARRPGLAPGLPVLESGVLAARPSTQAVAAVTPGDGRNRSGGSTASSTCRPCARFVQSEQQLAHRHRMFMRPSGGGVGFVRVPTNSAPRGISAGRELLGQDSNLRSLKGRWPCGIPLPHPALCPDISRRGGKEKARGSLWDSRAAVWELWPLFGLPFPHLLRYSVRSDYSSPGGAFFPPCR